MRSARLLGALAVAVMVAAGVSAGSAQAATTVVGPGDSIQAAIDVAHPGDTIVVRGVHHENVAITTDGITLRGIGAVLEPAATPLVNACTDPTAPEDVNGICILGDVDFETGEVNREIENVTVKGFTVRGFSEGIVVVGGHSTTFQGNVAEDNEEYGITAFSSTRTKFLFNRASDAHEAGVALLGAHDVNITGNLITGNVPSGETAFSGGVVVASGIGNTPPTDNQVHGNVVLHNQPDLFWDGTGTGNAFQGNRCESSVPARLCH